MPVFNEKLADELKDLISLSCRMTRSQRAMVVYMPHDSRVDDSE